MSNITKFTPGSKTATNGHTTEGSRLYGNSVDSDHAAERSVGVELEEIEGNTIMPPIYPGITMDQILEDQYQQGFVTGVAAQKASQDRFDRIEPIGDAIAWVGIGFLAGLAVALYLIAPAF